MAGGNELVSPEDSLVGHTVARFEVDGFVGEEALGKVYAAIEKTTGRRVTLKVLAPNLVDNYEGASRFQREMVASASVAEHPNAVAMLDFGSHHGIFHYIVLEAFDARSLADELVRGPLDVERAVRVAHQIASVLGVAHVHNVVHRNLNDENVLLLNNADGDYVKIRDFGMSRVLDPESAGDSLTGAAARVGTVAYQSPEYIEGSVVDPRGDLYALGILLYQMLTGQVPFRGKKAKVIEAHCTAPVPRPSVDRKGIPGWVDDLVYALLQKEPDHRPPDGETVMRLIEKGLGQRVELPRIVVPVTKSQLAAAPTVGRTAAAAGAAGAAAFVLFGVAILLVIAILGMGYLLVAR